MERFQSICAVCGRPIPAAYVRRGDAVYAEKTCPEHGPSRALASENAEEFERWLRFPSVTVPPRVTAARGVRKVFPTDADGAEGILNTECPYHCGVCENHLMTACCVLLNVTSACNQHCPYCFADAGEPGPSGSSGASGPSGQSGSSGGFGPSGGEARRSFDDPGLAEIGRRLDRLIELGEERKFNIQLNGGEPTVRDDLPEIVRLCKEKGFEYVQLNTNGRRLAGVYPDADLGGDAGAAYAKSLKAAGLSAVFLQFDGVDDSVYEKLRGEPLLEIKKAAIRNCGAAGLPVTLVPTVLKGVNLDSVGAIVDFMLAQGRTVKGVHFQPASFFGRRPDERNADGDYDGRVTMFAVMEEIEKQTGGRVGRDALAPISTGHPLCCFCAAFLRERDGSLTPMRGSNECCAPADPLEIVRRDRDFVLNKWETAGPAEDCRCAPPEDCRGNTPDEITGEAPEAPEAAGEASEFTDTALSFDDAIAYLRGNMFTISGMAFMDAGNLDAERLRRCRVQVFTEEGRLVPFCGYYTV
ncbi:MAG: radical SAM protein [Clostridiales Family XIII bacterium]|jgi:uncharacterized radical SAM superfamily Fe-S cluster-containing enzyme|nr:radical SAM protein [Clostridiales Family XIII bacterium]